MVGHLPGLFVAVVAGRAGVRRPPRCPSVNGDAWTPRMQLKALDLLEKYPAEAR